MAEFLRKYATATHVYIPMVKRAVVDFAVGADWTPAAGDVKVSIDGGAVANIATLPVAIASGNGAMWDFALSSGETTGKKISVITVDAATKAVEDQMFNILTYGNASAELVPDYSAALATPTNITAGTITTVTTVTNQLTAAAIATGVWQDATAGDFTTASSIGKSLYTTGNAPGAASGIALVGSNMGTITGALTAAQIATGVWQDTTAGDFTTALSVGKSVMNGVSLGTGLTVNSLTNLPAITANWLTAAGINAGALNGKGDWMVSYTQPTGFLAATFPSGTIANQTNITGGTITTATNLTNAATAGDITATMAATVKTQAVAALNTDTYAEPAQGTPAATTTLVGKIGFLYKAWRNKTTQDATTYSLFNDDAATVDHKGAVSDDGSTFTRGEIATGP